MKRKFSNKGYDELQSKIPRQASPEPSEPEQGPSSITGLVRILSVQSDEYLADESNNEYYSDDESDPENITCSTETDEDIDETDETETTELASQNTPTATDTAPDTSDQDRPKLLKHPPLPRLNAFFGSYS